MPADSGSAGTLILGAFEDDRPSLDERAQALQQDEDRRHERLLDWSLLAQSDPPPFEWIIPGWLSYHLTLCSGRGSIGKSLLWQQIGTMLSLGMPVFGAASPPMTVLYWACEDDEGELWRRQERICSALQVPLGSLSRLHVDARSGIDSQLYTLAYGAGQWCAPMVTLRDQCDRLRPDVLILDNIGHLYGAGENVRSSVTQFCNGIIGLVQDRPFCPVLLGHVAKSQGSEFSGSTAWENAARMRWWLSDTLPDQESGDKDPTDSVRYLSKRKTNYGRQDYLQAEIVDPGVFRFQEPPAIDAEGGLVRALRTRRARSVVLEAIPKIRAMGKISSEAPGANYLPRQMTDLHLADGYTRAELRDALMALLAEGQIVRAQVDRDSARRPRMGLILTG
jgi:RecA-family ATPase